jgi:nicotinate-nucleotide adenylyltransferase
VGDGARKALFGGTFDPIHNGHLEIARAAAERFGLGRVLFVPAGNPPHKPGGVTAPWEDRARMVELACADAGEGDERFEVSRIEAPVDGGRSYSIVTIEKLLAMGYAPLSFLIGADAFREIRTWHRWREVVAAVEFIVVTRPGASFEIPAGARVRELGGLDLPVSSSDIRKQVADGAEEVAVPAAVLTYIRERGLYGSTRLPFTA